MAKWYDIKAAASGDGQQPATIFLYDEIGYWGSTAKDFADDLKALGTVSDLTVRINSGGGELFAGIAIHNLLKSHPAKVTVKIDGFAGSIASVIAMAGDVVEMPSNTMMMIHNVSWWASGTADDLREAAGIMDQMRKSLVAAYRAKTGLDDAKLGELLTDSGTWMTAAEAKDLGFCDVVTNAVEATNFASVTPGRYAKVPEAVAARLTATPSAPPPATQPVTDRAPMTTPPNQPAPATPPAATDTTPATAQQVADLCAKSGYPELIAGLLNGTPTIGAVNARIDAAKKVKDACDRHRVGHLVKNLVGAVADGMSVETALALAADAAATRDEGIVTDTTRPPSGGESQGAAAAFDYKGVYNRMNHIKG